MLDKLPRAFYNRDTVQVAHDLLGQHIVRVLPNGTHLVCRITETEAYVGPVDKACHAYNYRRTKRNETMFNKPGTAYIYLIYGMYYCLNFVTEAEGEPCAVLIRGAVPVKNADIISEFRYGCKQDRQTSYQRRHFLNGPGKLCKGFMIDTNLNNLSCGHSTLYLADELPELGLPCRDATFHYNTGKRIGEAEIRICF